VKISATRLKQIIKEELFYREFHREGHELQEAEKAKDERISRKIAYLVDKEGKSRDQAVAIAHSMEGRGDLEEASSPSPAHPRGWEPLPRGGDPAAKFLQKLKAEKAAIAAAAERKKRGEASTPASTTNLKRFDRAAPEEKDPENVGLDTLEMTEKEYEQWRARGFFDKDKF
jgi:hypothetical protein